MSIWRWPQIHHGVAPADRVSLGEGNTPLIRSRHIGPRMGLAHLYFKSEASNPTGSYKDRFATAAISQMRARAQTRCIATSSGNTGSALAAYCAAASISCYIAIVETAPDAKLQQMLAYGAHIFRIRGFGLDPLVSDQAFTHLKTFGNQQGSALQISSFTHSPLGMHGVMSISFELAEQIQQLDHVFCPAGGGGLCVAVARGFEVLERDEHRDAVPAVHCVQPAGNDTIATALHEGATKSREVDCTTRISGLQVPSVIDGDQVIQHCRSSGGTGHVVSDDEIWCAQQMLARDEGIFCEPAAAVSLAGALRAAAAGQVDPQSRIVCLVTGSGFKDEASVQRMNQDHHCPLIDLTEMQQVIPNQ